MRKVNFLIAGVQKGGTTALYKMLRQHPDIFLPDQKEVHFFDNEGIDWSLPNYNIYHEFFSNAENHQIMGEATPIYMFWKNSLKRIHAYNPNMKLIVSLRNPAERAYSHWKMEVSRDIETLAFLDAIWTEQDRLVDEASWRQFSYVKRGFYGEQLSRAISLFPKDNILVLQQEDLLKNAVAVTDKICDFLGVEQMSFDNEFVRPIQNLDTFDPLLDSDRNYLNDIYKADQKRLNSLNLQLD